MRPVLLCCFLSVVSIHSVLTLSLYGDDDSLEQYLQQDQAKLQLFPSNQDPPEETLELWMKSAGGLPGVSSSPGTSALLDKVSCLMTAARSTGHQLSLYRALVCTKYRRCEQPLAHLADVCLVKSCDAACQHSSEPGQCIDMCVSTPPASSTSPQQTKPDTVQAASSEHFSPPDKRYRLGLYDCISSYCSSLHGEDRKSCIVYYCHRSATAQ